METSDCETVFNPLLWAGPPSPLTNAVWSRSRTRTVKHRQWSSSVSCALELGYANVLKVNCIGK